MSRAEPLVVASHLVVMSSLTLSVPEAYDPARLTGSMRVEEAP